MEEGDDPYEILGVSPTATAKEIRKAYFAACRKYHPDKAKTEEEVQRNTVLMFKINDAKDVLLDEEKRREYDASRKGSSSDGKGGESGGDGGGRQQSSSSSPPPGGAYSTNKEKFRRKPQPKPSNLGEPYRGHMGWTPFFFDGDGRRGSDARNGVDGSHGSGHGGSGRSGTDAGQAGHGHDGCDMDIHLKTTVSEDGYFEVDVHCSRGQGEVMDPSRDNLRTVPLKVFEKVDWTARGGHGGNGGVGGNGGNGCKGRPGRDANGWTRQPGTNGGPGGDGGDGGRGTHGGDGGRGGDVEIVVDRNDTYLLMRVAGCDPRSDTGPRQDGGRGGAAGRHGRGGRGGGGGRGGSSSYYTTTHYEWRNGERFQVEVRHEVPGGYRGRHGSTGSSFSTPLYGGENGQTGDFHIRVRESNGIEHRYEHRYDLVFQSTTTKQLSDMKQSKTFEFGETVIISSCSVRNTGGMESPSQRVMIAFDDVRIVTATREDRLFLARNKTVKPGNQQEANQEYLRFSCPYPSTSKNGTDFDPIHQDGSMKFTAHQLGPENRSQDVSTISDFQEKYKDFHQSAAEVVHMAFPVENRAGIRGVSSLDVQETTWLDFNLVNTSNQSLGSQSETGRNLFVQLYYADDEKYEIPLEHIQVRGDGGRTINIDPTLHPKGHRQMVSYLPGGGDKSIRLSFKLDTDEARLCSRAALQADLYIEKIPTLKPDGNTEKSTKKRLVQRRKFVVSCQPKFQEEDETDVVLVTTTASNPYQVSAWKSLLEERLGLTWKPYSLSRYGHLDAAQPIEAVEMEKNFEDKLVIVLNEEFTPQHNLEEVRKKVCRPSQLMNSAYDFDPTTNFLVVGGETKAVQHLSPKATGVNTVAFQEPTVEEETENRFKVDNQQNRKAFKQGLMEDLLRERTSGFVTERVAPSCRVVTIKTNCVFEPKPQKMEGILKRRTKNMSNWLKKQDLLRPYNVEWNPLASPKEFEKKACWSCWEIGELRVYSGPPRFQNSMVLVGEEDKGGILTTEGSIRSPSMLFSTLNAAAFDTKIAIFCRSLESLSKSHSDDHVEVCQIVIDCLACDFVWDVSNYLDGRMKITNVRDRSQTLNGLISNERLLQIVEEALADDQLRKTVTTHLSALVASLKCAAKSKDLRPWWAPFSRKHAVCKDMLESISFLEERWNHVLDEEQMLLRQQEIKEKAKKHIKTTRQKMLVSTRGRWRAALTVIHSPKNEEKYARVPGFSASAVRIRKHAEFDTGATTKVKAFFPETTNPQQSEKARRLHSSHRTYMNNVLNSTQTDRQDFIIPSQRS